MLDFADVVNVVARGRDGDADTRITVTLSRDSEGRISGVDLSETVAPFAQDESAKGDGAVDRAAPQSSAEKDPHAPVSD